MIFAKSQIKFYKWAVHKRRSHTIAKLDPSYSKMSALAQLSSTFFRADTPEISKNPKIFAPKSANVRI